MTSQERLARQYMQLARALKDQGQAGQAKAAWTHALNLLTDLASTNPGIPALQESRWDCANDFAWFLLGEPDAAEEDVHLALRLAEQATQAEPESSTYWNTLGAALHRAGDASGAIAALERSMALGDGGTAFDHIFMALAHAQRGRREEARRWYVRATAWIEQHDSHHPGLLRLYEEAGGYLDPRDVPSSVS